MFPGSRTRRVHRADNLTAICEPIIWTMWDNFTFFFTYQSWYRASEEYWWVTGNNHYLRVHNV
jgi:hypothetical protein